MKLTHIGISNYRSIGETPVMIDLEKKITVLVGQNDVGKSNVLGGMEHAVRSLTNKKALTLTALDFHKRNEECRPLLNLRALNDETHFQDRLWWPIMDFATPLWGGLADVHCPQIDSLTSEQISDLAGIWQISSGLGDPTSKRKELCVAVSRQSVNVVMSWTTLPKESLLIPQFRRIEDAETHNVTGAGVVRLLAHWKQPPIGEDHLQARYSTIENLLRDLLNRPQVTLEVPSSQNQMIVRDGRMRLPLESHGTGVHQLIILAIAVISQDNAVVSIEEPEIHLHPVLQKRFLQFLLRETNNRYIITTHSPALIAPSEEVDVIHLKMVDGVTIPARVETDAGSLAVLEDLGIQPSDLLQANSVIWVEGPSDRTYIKRWIEILHPTLVEGIDYSIMFYGGRLLAHLSMEREDEEEIVDLVKLLRINQRSALVMDSDRGDSKAELNETKKRLIQECEANGVPCWVTDGREIENYLADRTVEAALTEHGQLDGKVSIKPFVKFDTSMQHALRKPRKSWCDYSLHKAAWAHRFSKHIQADDISMELEKQVDALIRALKPGDPRPPAE